MKTGGRHSAGIGKQAEASALLAGVELEQARMAQLLHDSVCQSASAAEFLAKILGRRIGKTYPEISADFEDLSRLLHSTGQGLASLNQSLTAPEALEDLAAPLARAVHDQLAGRDYALTCPANLPISDGVGRHFVQMVRELCAPFAAGRGERLTLAIQQDPAGVRLNATIDFQKREPFPVGSPAWQLLELRAGHLQALLTIDRLPHQVSIRCHWPGGGTAT